MAHPQLHIVFHAVGAGSQGGDAIAIRYVDPGNDPRVVVIDSGKTSATAEAVARTVREAFEADRIDLLIITHSDDDHARGAVALIDLIDVTAMWANDPVRDPLGGLTASASTVVELLDSAIAAGVKVEPARLGRSFDGGAVELVGPSDEYYEGLLPRIFTEAQRDAALDDRAPADTARVAAALSATTDGTVRDSWSEEVLLGSRSSTEPSNNASAITLLRLGEWTCLFTGDAGVEALSSAAAALAARRYEATAATLVQAPHHGSKKNLDSASADLLAGPVMTEDNKYTRGMVVISAPASDSGGHPSKRVVNAFVRRGRRVFTTSGGPFNVVLPSPGEGSGYRIVHPLDFEPEIPANH